MSGRDQADDRLGEANLTMMRAGGISALVVGLSYPIIIALYVLAGSGQPIGQGGQAWLEYMAGHEAAWWAIVGLSVLTNVLWVPVAWALYWSLATVDRAKALAGSALLVLFVVLELATSWPNYAVLIDLSTKLATPSDDAQRMAVLGAAGYAAAAQSSSLLPYYTILTPALGQLLLGLTMLKGGPYGRLVGWLSVVAGAIGIVAVLGRAIWEPLGQAIIPGSLLTAVWFVLIGRRLLGLAAGR